MCLCWHRLTNTCDCVDAGDDEDDELDQDPAVDDDEDDDDDDDDEDDDDQENAGPTMADLVSGKYVRSLQKLPILVIAV
jgi:hypothetical protein